ncbi:AAA family ATPase [Streptomyces sp. NPDC048172]|uniref:AAA family ATPase n=1 Tax=Streptomyces sp. NPDC048172 TaxID=3365505 RepID=UPI00371AB2B3
MVTRIAVAGTHSTGKTTLLDRLETKLRATGLTVARPPGSFAVRAAELGFPKLQQQSPECAEWIIASSTAAVAEATLHADVVLMDRSAIDPMAYYLAALEHSDHEPDPAVVERLSALVAAHTAAYDGLLATVLDPAIPLGPHRDRDLEYRAAVDRYVHDILRNLRIPHQWITGPDDEPAVLDALVTLTTGLVTS